MNEREQGNALSAALLALLPRRREEEPAADNAAANAPVPPPPPPPARPLRLGAIVRDAGEEAANAPVAPPPPARSVPRDLFSILRETAPCMRLTTLTREEHRQAVRLKKKIEADPETDDLSDFDYAQLVISSWGDVEEALRRAQGQQEFLKDYDVTNTVAQGTRCVEDFLASMPECFLSLSNKPGEAPVWAVDWSKWYSMSSRTSLRGLFYLHQASQSDLEQIREGMVYLIDCRGFDWKKNFGWGEYLDLWNTFSNWYPARRKSGKCYHTTVLANVLFSMARKLFPKNERALLDVGCVSPGGPLHRLYFVPTPEAARERILQAVACGLRRRCSNLQSFSLDDPPR